MKVCDCGATMHPNRRSPRCPTCVRRDAGAARRLARLPQVFIAAPSRRGGAA
jgi:hypothetical protein